MASSVLKKLNLLGVFTIWRLILSMPLVIGAYLIPYNPSAPIAYIFHYINSIASFNSIFLFPWANFDGIHYLNIAEFGYTNQARFFPLFPIAIKFFSGAIVPTLLCVSVIFFLALYFFRKLIILDFKNEIANRSLFLLLLFPTSFFFVSIYSEGLFLLLTILSFYFARKNRWLLAVVFASALMATRFVGLAILPALLYEFVIEKNKRIKLALFFIAPLGLILYSIFNYFKWHDFLYFITAQGELGNNRSVNSVILFPQTIYRYFKILSTVPVNSYDWSIALLELATFIFAACLLYLAWKKKIRTSYLIFAIGNFIIATATGTFSGLPRYVITLFPIFIALALVKNNKLKFAYIMISPILLFILLMLFSRGYFVA